MKKVEYKIEDNDCYRCVSHATNSEGYVSITIKGKQMYGHRYMYLKRYGEINSEVIRHTCDNRWCINPDHLIEGSHQDNVMDRVKRGRSAIGVNNGRSKLNEKQVLEIYKNTTSTKDDLAKKYKVDPKVIRDIKNKITWKHVTKNL